MTDTSTARLAPTLATLKPGDEVVVTVRSYGADTLPFRFDTVSKVTATQIMLAGYGAERFDRKTGKLRGGTDNWHTPTLRPATPEDPVGAPTVLKFERPAPAKRAGPGYGDPPAQFENRVEVKHSPRYIDSDTLTEADIGRRFHVSRRVGTGITIRPGVYLLVSLGVTQNGMKLARLVAGGVDGRLDLRRLCLTPVDGDTRLLDTRPPGNTNAIGVFVKCDGSRHPILVDPSLIPSAEV